MPEHQRWAKARILITARTYPVPSKKLVEVSCTAGITDDGKWIRLFPVPYRFLAPDKRFSKYQYVETDVTKSRSDTRPESYKTNADSIRIVSESPLSTANRWEARKAKVFPLKSDSLCSLQSQRDRNQSPTLGFFKPKNISAFRMEKTADSWTETELTSLRQYPLFGRVPRAELEKLPYNFFYEFKCDRPDCPSHLLSCIDWEMGASYWSWRNKYGANWERKFRDKYEIEMILGKDTHFFVGTIHSHPNAWVIIGLFYPPK